MNPNTIRNWLDLIDFSGLALMVIAIFVLSCHDATNTEKIKVLERTVDKLGRTVQKVEMRGKQNHE